MDKLYLFTISILVNSSDSCSSQYAVKKLNCSKLQTAYCELPPFNNMENIKLIPQDRLYGQVLIASLMVILQLFQYRLLYG